MDKNTNQPASNSAQAIVSTCSDPTKVNAALELIFTRGRPLKDLTEIITNGVCLAKTNDGAVWGMQFGEDGMVVAFRSFQSVHDPDYDGWVESLTPTNPASQPQSD